MEGAALGGVPSPSFLGVVLLSPRVWCCLLFALAGASLLLLGALIVSISLVGGAASPLSPLLG